MLPCRRHWLVFIYGLLLGLLVSHVIQTAWLIKATESDAERSESAQPAGRQIAKSAPATSMMDIPAELHKRVRILCLIMTHAGNYQTKATAVNNTWARRCNRYAFVGCHDTKVDIPLIRINITESYGNLWQKVWMSMDYAYKNFNLNDFDFVLKADDDTYVVMENLRMLLLPMDPNQASVIGRNFWANKQKYMSGGAGYVLSRRAVQVFLEQLVHKGSRHGDCVLNTKPHEDLMMGICYSRLGFRHTQSLDSNGLERFHPIDLKVMIGGAEMPAWMHERCNYTVRSCLDCISSVSISFHYTYNMYELEFLLYHMRPVGVDPAAKETLELMKRLRES